jgi:hypothetical protein
MDRRPPPHCFLQSWDEGVGEILTSCRFFGRIALLDAFMAKANYPGNMPVSFWIQRERILN